MVFRAVSCFYNINRGLAEYYQSQILDLGKSVIILNYLIDLQEIQFE